MKRKRSIAVILLAGLMLSATACGSGREESTVAEADAEKIREEGDKLIVMIHYPPFSPKSPDTYFTEMFENNRADKVVFGHIHGATYFPFRTEKNAIEYVLTSCDKVGFTLQRIL